MRQSASGAASYLLCRGERFPSFPFPPRTKAGPLLTLSMLRLCSFAEWITPSHRSKSGRPLSLTPGTPVRGPPGEKPTPDKAPALRAPFPAAAVYLKLTLKRAGQTAAIYKVRYGGAAASNGPVEHLATSPDQPIAGPAIELARGGRRIDASGEKRLVGVDVTYPDHHRGVHEEVLYRPRSASRSPEKIDTRKLWRERLRPQTGKDRPGIGVSRGDDPKRPEAAGVIEPELKTSVQDEPNVVMALPWRPLGEEGQPPGHPQVEHQEGPVLHGHDEELGSPGHRLHPLPFDPPLEATSWEGEA
jgi:hypothetical protein